jgi:hypothetical protein
LDRRERHGIHNSNRFPLAKPPALGVQRRTRMEVSLPASKTLPWKLAGNEDVAVGFEL